MECTCTDETLRIYKNIKYYKGNCKFCIREGFKRRITALSCSSGLTIEYLTIKIKALADVFDSQKNEGKNKKRFDLYFIYASKTLLNDFEDSLIDFLIKSGEILKETDKDRYFCHNDSIIANELRLRA